MTAVADKLRDARALVEPRGAWIQGGFKTVLADGTHAYCMAGAVIEVCNGVMPSNIKCFLVQAINSKLLYAFNDAPSRKKADVLAAFDRAIELAESEPMNALHPKSRMTIPQSDTPGTEIE